MGYYAKHTGNDNNDPDNNGLSGSLLFKRIINDFAIEAFKNPCFSAQVFSAGAITFYGLVHSNSCFYPYIETCA